MENIDYAQIKNSLKEIVLKIFENYKKEHDIRDICGFALYSDEDAMSISIALNTYEYLKNNIKDDPENESYYKFSPEEWNEIIENDELDKLNKILEKMYFKIKNKQFLEHKEKHIN